MTLGLSMVNLTKRNPSMNPSVRLPESPMKIFRFLLSSPQMLK